MNSELICKLIKEKFENICDCSIIGNGEKFDIHVLVCKGCIKNGEIIYGENKYFLIKTKDTPILLEDLQQLIEFYEKFVVNKCNNRYRQVQLVICIHHNNDIDPLVRTHIDTYNILFEDTRPPILILKVPS